MLKIKTLVNNVNYKNMILHVMSLAVLLSSGQLFAEDKSKTEELTSHRGSYAIQYHAIPGDIPLNEMFKLNVEIKDRGKSTCSGNVELMVDAGMEAHNHGMFTTPEVTKVGDCNFLVDGMLFHMIGEWQINFSIQRGLMSDRAKAVVFLEK